MEEKSAKRGTAEVDRACLDEVERWRDRVARAIDFANPADVARHDQKVALVEQRLDLHNAPRPSRCRTSRPCSGATPKAEATDRQIDQLVYQLYELSDAEIRIVEEGTARS